MTDVPGTLNEILHSIEVDTWPDDTLIVVIPLPEPVDGHNMVTMTMDGVSALNPLESMVTAGLLLDEFPAGMDVVIGVCSNMSPEATNYWSMFLLTARKVGISASVYAVRGTAWCCMSPDDECGCEVSAGELVSS